MSNKVRLISLFLLIFLTLFIFPRPARADILGIADSFWGWVESSLDALDFVDTTILNTFFKLGWFVTIAMVYILFSAWLLEWAISIPINLRNDLVLAGWRFTTGLTNLLLIIIFVAIALTYILKIETFAAKKALPRLIIVALLINFSLVFVGIFVDIAQITLNSIINALGGNIFSTVALPLALMQLPFLLIFILVFVVYTAVALIPPANVAASYLLAAGVTIAFFTGPLMLVTFLGIVTYVLASVFFSVFMFFLFRLAMIWILAIFAPLAFACWILPQTQKYWQKWLNALIEWLTFGIIVIFLAGLGARLLFSTNLLPFPTDISFSSLISFFTEALPGVLVNYLFLLIYMAFVLQKTKQYTPAFAGVLMGYATGLASRAAQVGKGVARDIKRRLEPGLEERRKKEEEKIKAKEKELGRPLKPREKLATMGLGGIATRVALATYAARRTTPGIEMAKEVNERVIDFEKRYGDRVGDAASEFETFNEAGKAAFIRYATKMKGREGLETLSLEQRKEGLRALALRQPEKLKEVIAHSPELIDNRELEEKARKLEEEGKKEEAKSIRGSEPYQFAKFIQEKMVSKGLEKDEKGIYKDRDVQKLAEIYKEKLEKGIMKDIDLIREAAFKKAVDALKIPDIERLSTETIENSKFQEMVARFKPWGFISKLGEERGLDYLEKIQEKAEEIGLKQIEETNPSFYRAPYTPFGRLLLRPWEKTKRRKKRT